MREVRRQCDKRDCGTSVICLLIMSFDQKCWEFKWRFLSRYHWRVNAAWVSNDPSLNRTSKFVTYHDFFPVILYFSCNGLFQLLTLQTWFKTNWRFLHHQVVETVTYIRCFMKWEEWFSGLLAQEMGECSWWETWTPHFSDHRAYFKNCALSSGAPYVEC